MTGTTRTRLLRILTAMTLVASLIGATIVLWPRTRAITVSGLFSSAVGLYPGDDVKMVGVRIGTITSIAPGDAHTRVTMTVRSDVPIPADAQALIVAPNLVSSRFVEFTPAYDQGPQLADGAEISADRTAVPVEWDQVKAELTKISAQLGPKAGALQGPLANLVNQAADTFDGTGETFRRAVRELSHAAGTLSDSRTDLFGTISNLRILVDALAASNTQMVEFSTHVAAVTQVLADSSRDLNTSLAALNTALKDVRGFLQETNGPLTEGVNRLADFTTLLTQHSDDIEQVLHVAPNGLANFYNIYNPAQGSIAGILTVPNLANPVQFICGTLDTAGEPDYYRRAEICRQRMAPVLRRLATNFPPILAHPINSITAYKGQIIYDTPQTEAKARTPVSQLQWMPAPGSEPPAAPQSDDVASMLLPPSAPAPAPSDSPVQGATAPTPRLPAPAPTPEGTP